MSIDCVAAAVKSFLFFGYETVFAQNFMLNL